MRMGQSTIHVLQRPCFPSRGQPLLIPILASRGSKSICLRYSDDDNPAYLNPGFYLIQWRGARQQKPDQKMGSLPGKYFKQPGFRRLILFWIYYFHFTPSPTFFSNLFPRDRSTLLRRQNLSQSKNDVSIPRFLRSMHRQEEAHGTRY